MKYLKYIGPMLAHDSNHPVDLSFHDTIPNGKSFNKFIISHAVSGSKFPVGSSAISIDGLLTKGSNNTVAIIDFDGYINNDK